MDKTHLETFAFLPRPGRESMTFMEELRRPLRYSFRPGGGCPDGIASGCLAEGAAISLDFSCIPGGVPETAFESLRRVLAAREIPETDHGYPLRFVCDRTFEHEEYSVAVKPDGATVAASDSDGLRRAIYFLEDRIREAEGKSATLGVWRRKPFIKRRISRCFFGPTYRPPFCIDELMNDINYYPEEYLNRLAHEGINGLWLTLYFRDLPSRIFPNRGADAEKRFAKLRETVERCEKYGIKIYVFLCEPKLWGNASFAIPESETTAHPELVADKVGNFRCFCNWSPTAERYIEESVTRLFHAVPKLGGMINIMLGEDNGSCVSYQVSREIPGQRRNGPCPAECKGKSTAAVYRRFAELFSRPMKRISPDAEFIGWFYTPAQRDGSAFSQRLSDAVSEWPDDVGIMFNFESGGIARQLGRARNVFDYSLAFAGPSELFRHVAAKTAKPAAKLQVGCSHEDASVPFIPVPGHLYRKYRAMKSLGVCAAMQCWYFGNYPGLMNKAAGELSFLPFPKSREKFLLELAKPDWGRDATRVAEAWKWFSRGYENFPANIAFAWYGPLHHSIVWPLHLFPVDEPLAPSWLLENYPRVSGDRVGECLVYQHTLPEAITLCRKMRDNWKKGSSLLKPLVGRYAGDPDRSADLMLAEAIELQMESTLGMLEFYSLREDMFYEHRNHLDAMRKIVEAEIDHSLTMAELCRRDSRLGYHSEAEGYLFYPEKLLKRVQLLKELLEVDFPKFNPDAEFIDEYTGRTVRGPSARAPFGCFGEKQPFGPGMSWCASHDGKTLSLKLEGTLKREFLIEIEACRLWSALTMRFDASGRGELDTFILRAPETPKVTERDGVLTITFPLEMFRGFRREGFPMRINLRGKDFAWVEYQSIPSRLLHDDFNPKCAGWLILEPEQSKKMNL